MIAAQLEHTTRRFGAITALEDVSLSLAPGTLTALLGPNGAGKTTAVRLLLGLARPDSGRVTVFGHDPQSPAARVRCGAMLQSGRVPETLRVREHIDLFSSYYPRPLPLRNVIEAAGLDGLENRMFGQLSGGQKQRVLFALAICGSPGLLILDEPTVGLDVETRRALWRQIRQMVSGGTSVLLTTHYLEEADALADRVVVLDRGRITADGSPAEIKARTAHRLIRCVTTLDATRVSAISGIDRVHSDGARMEIYCANPDIVLPQLYALDPHLSGLEVGAAALEDAFLALTKHEVIQ